MKEYVAAHPELARAQDTHGRTAISVASKSNKAAMQSVLLWHGRYALTEDRPEHASATCFVYKAVDELRKDEFGHPIRVAIKLMRHKEQVPGVSGHADLQYCTSSCCRFCYILHHSHLFC